MLGIYRSLTLFFYPLFIIIIYCRKLLKKENDESFKAKLFPSNFLVDKDKTKKLIWFHAASIGEAQSIIPLIKKILISVDSTEIIITTITQSSAALMKKNFEEHQNVRHRYLPLDVKFLIDKFLDGWKPSLVLFVDSEIWPNFLSGIKQRNIPLILLNGRITKRSFLRWSKISNLAEEVFNKFDLCLVSNFETKKYLESFKVKNIKFLGNLKFSMNYKSYNSHNILPRGKKIWCAMSTHAGEDIFIIKTHLSLKNNNKDLISLIIPRHINRVKEIEALCKKDNLSFQTLSENERINFEKEIIIINSYGKTSEYLNLCNSVFIGKSLIKKLQNVGGQNPIEAAKLGCKIYHGPYVYNFQEIYNLLNSYKISEQITNINDLSKKINFDMNNPDYFRNEDALKDINELGKKILSTTFEEVVKLKN